MRTLSWMVAGVLAWVLACATSEEFACSGDADCFLADTPGICAEGGHCAYPNEECSSGYAYPTQTPDIGGTCVPGDSATGGTGDDDDDGTGTGEGGTTSADGDSDSGDSTGNGGATSTGGTSTSGAESSTGASVCEDEVGNDSTSASVVGACSGFAGSVIVDESDVDWWALVPDGADCPPTEYLVDLEGPVELDVEVCMLIECDGTDPTIQCERGALVSTGLFTGCCDDTGEAAGTFSCGDDAIKPFVRVTPLKSFVCGEYDFTVEPP